MLIVCSPFGLHSIPEYGLRAAQRYAEHSLFLHLPPSTPIPVCCITLVSHTLMPTDIPALTPFRNSQTGFWASSGTNTTASLHYTYPEFNNVNTSNPGAVQRAIANWVNNHYGPGRFSRSSTGPQASLSAASDAGAAAAPEAQAAVSVAAAPQAHATGPLAAAASAIKSAAEDIAQHVHHHPSPSHPPGHGGTPPTIYDWSARIHAKKYEAGHGYLVLIFIGAVPDDYTQWRTCNSFVGAHVSFANAEADQCGNCREQAELVVEGFVHLNQAIAKCSPGLPSYEPEVVAPYLKENLHWRVQAVRSLSAQLFARFEVADTLLHLSTRSIVQRSTWRSSHL
jgi:tyrosinase